MQLPKQVICSTNEINTSLNLDSDLIPEEEEIQKALRTFKMILGDSKVLPEEIKVSEGENTLNCTELYKRKCLIDGDDFTLTRKISFLPLTLNEDSFTLFLKNNENKEQ